MVGRTGIEPATCGLRRCSALLSYRPLAQQRSAAFGIRMRQGRAHRTGMRTRTAENRSSLLRIGVLRKTPMGVVMVSPPSPNGAELAWKSILCERRKQNAPGGETEGVRGASAGRGGRPAAGGIGQRFRSSRSHLPRGAHAVPAWRQGHVGSAAVGRKMVCIAKMVMIDGCRHAGEGAHDTQSLSKTQVQPRWVAVAAGQAA